MAATHHRSATPPSKKWSQHVTGTSEFDGAARLRID